MSKYTDICELDKKLYNTLNVNLAKQKFNKLILTLIEPDIDELKDFYYSYGPDILFINSINLRLIKNIRNKIGNIEFGYRNKEDILYIPSFIYGCSYFEKDISSLNNILNENNYIIYKKTIDDINRLKKII